MLTEVIDGSNHRLPSRLCDWVSRRSAQEWYSPRSVRMEADAFVRLIRSRRSVCHILSGEDDLRYLGHSRLLRRLNRSRIVATYHQPPAVLDGVVDCARTARDLDAVIVLGSNQVPYFESILDRKRVYLIPHGIDTDYFAPANESRSGGRVCLFVGNWLRDFGMLRGVIERVSAQDPGVQFRLVVLEERTSELEGWKNTRLLHSLTDDELLKEYRSADLLVLPYVDVVASNALLEGLSCGLPVVTTDVGAMRDYVTSDCGYMVTPGDVTAMSQAVLTLVEDDRRRREMGVHGRQVALNHDWRRVAAAHLDLYRRLAA
jgi:glycosyltransferase involved in cell wall biosynthesis